MQELIQQASQALRWRVEHEGNSGRGKLIGGPCDGACAVLEICGRDCRDRETLEFAKVDSIIGAKPSADGFGYKYRQRKNHDGTPSVNIVGDILYDWIDVGKMMAEHGHTRRRIQLVMSIIVGIVAVGVIFLIYVIVISGESGD